MPTASSAPSADGGADDELVVLEHADRARVGVHELRRLLDDLVENRGRVELGREQAARARQLLRERPRAPLRLEQLAALERAARRVGEVARELEVVFGEDALLREEDDDEAAAPRVAATRRAPRAARDSRLAPPPLAPRRGKALVVGERRRREHAALRGGARRAARRRSRARPRSAAANCAGSSCEPRARAAARCGISTAAPAPPSASAAACATASSVAARDSDCPSTEAIR